MASVKKFYALVLDCYEKYTTFEPLKANSLREAKKEAKEMCFVGIFVGIAEYSEDTVIYTSLNTFHK